MNIWLSLEHIPGLSAIPFVWRQELGDNFDPFKSAFLQSAPDNPAQFVPCPRARGCHHEVRTRSTASHFQSPLTSEAGPPSTASDFQPSPTAPEVSTHSTASHFASPLIAVCRCYPGRCDSFSLTVEDVTSLELDWPKLGRALCRAFGLVSKPANPGLFNALQIASWSPDLSRQSTAAADAIPVILTIPSSSRELLHIAATLIARLGHPFILLAP